MSQNTIILEALKAAKGEWVSLTTLGELAHCYQVAGRISNIRHGQADGVEHTIENRIEIAVDGSKHSWYRLIEPVIDRPVLVLTGE